MKKIKTIDNISPAGLSRFPLEKYEIASEIPHPDAIIVRSSKLHEMEFPSSLQAIGRAGAGVNNIPVTKMTDLGIPVFNAPGANANAVKELVVAGMLIAARNLTQAWQFTQTLEGTDDQINKLVEGGKKTYVGYELPGKTLGVIGLGAIGVQIANVARLLGLNVIGYDPTITVKSAWQLDAGVTQAISIDDLLSQSDFVSFHVPLIEQTRHMINAERLNIMKPNAVILNFSRNGIVHDEAVVKALDSGNLHAYVCDFPSNLLKGHAQCITLPHLGASTAEAEDNCAIMIADQLQDFLENGNIRHSVNFPDIHLPRTKGYRLSIINQNVPNMLGQVSTLLANNMINILDMLNKSRDDVAITLIDVDKQLSAEVVAQLTDIDGILSIRCLGCE